MLRTLLVITLSLLALCHPVNADHKGHSVESMVQWIVDNSRFEYHGDPYPKVTTETALTVCSEIYPDSEPHADCNIAGYYDHDRNHIVISDTITEYQTENHFAEVVLPHELVNLVTYN